MIIIALAMVLAFIGGLALYAMYLATRPPVEGDVGEWQHVVSRRSCRAVIEPGGYFVTLTYPNNHERRITRDEFCRHYDKVRG